MELRERTEQGNRARGGTLRQMPLLSDRQEQALRDLAQIWRRIALQLMRSERLVKPWTIGVTSAIEGEGRTTTSIGIARAIAEETNMPVVLLETDFYRPALLQSFGVSTSFGLADYLSGACTLEQTHKNIDLGNLTIIPAGAEVSPVSSFAVDQRVAMLRKRFPQVLALLKQRFSAVIVDMPALLTNVNAESMVQATDGVLLVVRSGLTPMDKVRRASRMIDQSRMQGVIHIGEPTAIPTWLSQLMAE